MGWEERQKTRQLEMEAVSKALAVLSGDDAHDLFTRTFNPAFLQVDRQDSRRAQASKLLSDVAKRLNNPKLSNLAYRVRLDAFTRVKKAIAEMQVQMKRAGEDREKENKEFQTTVADQRETQKLPKAALNVLQDFYGKKAAFMQKHKQEPAGPPPPPGFEAYKKNAASGGVMKMIEEIISDAKAMEAEAIRSEEDAQKAYEDFVKETNASIETKSKEIVNKSELKAKAETDLVETKEAKEAVMLELEQLSNYNAELHQSCDFVMKNFEVRQTARDEEIEALKQAKAILSGAKFEEFLQSA